jgi:glycosyltransferase involved in cell wall biosynthesis
VTLRIAVCNGQIPFVRGGAEILADALIDQLRQRGHQAELIQVPFKWHPKGEVLKSYLAWRLINVQESEGQPIDRVISLKFPAFVVQHPYKVTWLVQQFRQAYDMFGTQYGYFDESEADTELRRAIWQMDTRTLSESRHIFTISDNVGDRLRRYNLLQSETLYPPPALDGQFYNRGYGDYVFSISRLNQTKRLDHLIRAMAHTDTSVRCKIAGRGEERVALQRLAREVGVDDRVEFLGFVSDDEALGLYAGALAVYYAPVDEDYGLATVEAMKSQKPVLTTDDSGGVLEFVDDGATGYVTPAGDGAAMAQRIDELYGTRDTAKRLGQAAHRKVAAICWDAVIDRLLEV